MGWQMEAQSGSRLKGVYTSQLRKDLQSRFPHYTSTRCLENTTLLNDLTLARVDRIWKITSSREATNIFSLQYRNYGSSFKWQVFFFFLLKKQNLSVEWNLKSTMIIYILPIWVCDEAPQLTKNPKQWPSGTMMRETNEAWLEPQLLDWTPNLLAIILYFLK